MEWRKLPYLQMTSTDGVTVMWETDLKGTTEVEIRQMARKHSAVAPFGPTQYFSGPSGVVHKVRVTGLSAGTDYFYRARTASGAETLETPWYSVGTQCGKDTPFSFCVTSETGGFGGFNENNYCAATFAAIRELRPDFLVFAGDMASNGRDRQDWDKYLFRPGAEVFRNTPFYLCMGNHEENTALLPELFDFPSPCNYYGFDWGGAHFTVLDSTTLFRYEEQPDGTWDAVETEEFREGSAQMAFLRQDLQKSAAAGWKFVVFHYPPYVSGHYEVPGLRKLCPLFEEHGVDVVFSSHTIVYERSYPLRGGSVDHAGGITYVVAGGAGAMPDWFLHKRQWHTAKSAARPHVVSVSVAGRRLEMEAVDLAGNVFDRFVIDKPCGVDLAKA